jgi:divalent metal cation (Fe/Co/Zn/Cd) transporter
VSGSESPKRRLHDISSRLLAESDAVKHLELEKRTRNISTPEFHRLAEEIEDRARKVFRLAEAEEQVSHRIPTDDESIDEVGRGESS